MVKKEQNLNLNKDEKIKRVRTKNNPFLKKDYKC